MLKMTGNSRVHSLAPISKDPARGCRIKLCVCERERGRERERYIKRI